MHAKHRNALIRIAIVSFSGLLGSCADSTIEVVVKNEHTGKPIAGAIVEGGFDWDSYYAVTDEEGRAMLPARAADFPPTISADNYHPKGSGRSLSKSYRLSPAPWHLTELGSMPGLLVKRGPGVFSTVDMGGLYEVFSYTPMSLDRIFSTRLGSGANSHFARGDTLWIVGRGAGVRLYNIANIMNPLLITHLNIPGDFAYLAETGGALYLHTFQDIDSIHAYTWNWTGEFGKIGSFTSNWFTSGLFTHKGVLFEENYGALKVWDVSDKGHGVEVFTASNPYFGRWTQKGDSLIHIPWVSLGGEYYRYELLDISDPANPKWKPVFDSEGQVGELVSDSLAIGSYDIMTAVLRRGDWVGDRYHTMAMIRTRDYDYEGFQISDNLIVLDERVWLLRSAWPE